MRRDRVLIVGAGIGGLAAAVELARQGVEVTVLERAASPGGKMRRLRIGDALLDAGPTVFTMRWVFEELFERAGTRLNEHLVLQPADVLARHAWDEATRLDLHADVARSADAIGRFAGATEARGYLRFCERARSTYRALEAPYLRGSATGPVGLAMRAGWAGLPGLARISPFTTLWRELGTHFRDPRLQQLFGRYATYCGSSPFSAPATLMLVAHVEQDGVWRVEGGMHAVALAVAALATRHGAHLRYGTEVAQLVMRGGRVAGVELVGGETLEADAVVFNGDVNALATGRLGRAAKAAVPELPPAQRSLSAVTWSLVATADGFPLQHHTVFFSRDSPTEFGDLFARSRLPASPTVYVCAQDRGDDGTAPAGGGPERLLCLVNAPAHADIRPLTSTELATCEQQTFDTLARCGLRLQREPALSVTTTPTDFERLFPATGGALYGRATHGWQASFARSGSRSRIPGLYLAGGSTHPGPGVPMAALSGSLAARCLMEDRARDRASTARSPAAATPGGMSTH